MKNIFHQLKEQIVEKSLNAFLEHGIRSMTMQKLSVTLGISTKTLYKYFADKEALLEECLAIHYAGMFADIIQLANDNVNPVEFIHTVYQRSTALDFGANHLFYHDLNYYYPELQDRVIGRQAGKLGSIFTDIMQRGIDEGYFLLYLQPVVTFKAISVLYASVTRFNSYAEFNLSPQQLVQHTIDIYVRGICSDKGLQIINRLSNFNQ